MASVIIDSIPDGDSFLPRHLTVQLIAILAKALPTANAPAMPTSPAAQHFINELKQLTLFTSLTSSIFWRENTASMLDNYSASLDDLDQYNRSALTMALANEDFLLASQLISAGAIVYLEDKLVLEIALASIIQRDPNNKIKIMTNTPADDQLWLQEYLDYLEAHLKGDTSKEVNKYHEVFDPTVRHFGQILDTLVYFNGTPSHYGFLSPSLDVLTRHLQLYAKELKDPIEQPLFAAIAKAFDYSYQTSKFHGNLPLINSAATDFVAKIQSNIKINSKDPVVIFGGWAGNCVAIAFINKNLIISNLGSGGDIQQGTKIYTINKPEAITVEAINTFMRGLAYATPALTVLGLLGEMVEAKPAFMLNQALNPIDNCIFVNPRAIIQGILLVLSGPEFRQYLPKVNEQYKLYLESLYKDSTHDLAQFMRNHELLRAKRIECCSLAIEFINQHYQNPNDIPRCIDLKNALEFVGLKDYYNNNVAPEAKIKIQQQMIHEQELTAIQVIQKEAEILSKQG